MSSATADDGHFVLPAGLTSPQREAVTDPGPLLSVLAGAGAGKTRVLTLRVARRVHDASAEPEHVLVATFSRKAATELRRLLVFSQHRRGRRRLAPAAGGPLPDALSPCPRR